MNLLHRDEMGIFGLSQVEHPADVLVSDLAGKAELIIETLDGFFVRGDFRLDKLKSDFFFDLRIIDLIDPAHPAFPDFFNNLVTAGEGRARGQLFNGRLYSFCDFGTDVLRRRQLCAAISTKMGCVRIG